MHCFDLTKHGHSHTPRPVAGIKWVMAVFDVPEAICVSRTMLCSASRQLTRIQAGGYYLGVLAYYWLLATPTVGFLFGCYLYLSVNL